MGIGKFHVLLVHFPIALIIATVVADLLWLLTRREFFKNAGFYCLIGALITGPIVALTGWYALRDLKLEGEMAEIADHHMDMAVATLVVVIAAVVVRIAWQRQPKRWLMVIYGILAAAMFLLVSLTGHFGGQLAFGKDYLTGS